MTKNEPLITVTCNACGERSKPHMEHEFQYNIDEEGWITFVGVHKDDSHLCRPCSCKVFEAVEFRLDRKEKERRRKDENL